MIFRVASFSFWSVFQNRAASAPLRSVRVRAQLSVDRRQLAKAYQADFLRPFFVDFLGFYRKFLKFWAFFCSFDGFNTQTTLSSGSTPNAGSLPNALDLTESAIFFVICLFVGPRRSLLLVYPEGKQKSGGDILDSLFFQI